MVVACRVPRLSNAFSGGKTIVLDGRRINIVCNDGFFYPGSSQTSYVAVCHSTGMFTPRLLDCRGFSGGKRKTDFQLTVKRRLSESKSFETPNIQTMLTKSH